MKLLLIILILALFSCNDTVRDHDEKDRKQKHLLQDTLKRDTSLIVSCSTSINNEQTGY